MRERILGWKDFKEVMTLMPLPLWSVGLKTPTPVLAGSNLTEGDPHTAGVSTPGEVPAVHIYPQTSDTALLLFLKNRQHT